MMNKYRNLIFRITIGFLVLAVSASSLIYLKNLKRAEKNKEAKVEQIQPNKAGKSESSRTAMDEEAFEKEVIYSKGLKGYLCKPEGAGPSPAVIFNHGGSSDQIGGDPKGMCSSLKDEGFVGFSPIRTSSSSIEENLSNGKEALDYLKKLEYVDTNRIGIIGFSKGVLITYDTAVKSPENIKGMVLMAGELPDSYEDGFQNAKKLKSHILLLVSENDTPTKINGNKNMVSEVSEMKSELEKAGLKAEMIIYPPYSEGHGHTMFFEVGSYFKDIVEFFKKNL